MMPKLAAAKFWTLYVTKHGLPKTGDQAAIVDSIAAMIEEATAAQANRIAELEAELAAEKAAVTRFIDEVIS